MHNIAFAVAGAAYVAAVADSLYHYEGNVSRIEALPQPQQHSTPGSSSPTTPAPAPTTPAPSPATPAPAAPSPATTPATSARVVPWVTPSGGGLALSFRF